MPTPEEFQKLVADEAAKETAQKDQLAAVVEHLKQWWPAKVKALLDQVGEWIGPLVQGGSLTFERRPVMKHEELLGNYNTETGYIKLGGKQMTIDPAAARIFGGFGRVDITAPIGHAILLLLGDSQEKASWHIAHPIAAGGTRPSPFVRGSQTPTRKPTFVPLTQETFQQLFVDLFGIGGR